MNRPATLLARGLRVGAGRQGSPAWGRHRGARGRGAGRARPVGGRKSTLFRALVGEDPPDEGTVSIDGEDVTRWPLWRRARAGVGYVPQGPSVLWDLTVRQNLDAFRLITRLAPRRRGVAADARGARPSAGRARRGALVRRAPPAGAGARRHARSAVCWCATSHSPASIPVGAERLGDLLLSGWPGPATAVILADHHVAEALRVCTHATFVLDGRSRPSAPAAEFPSHPLVRGRYLGTWQRTAYRTGQSGRESDWHSDHSTSLIAQFKQIQPLARKSPKIAPARLSLGPAGVS